MPQGIDSLDEAWANVRDATLITTNCDQSSRSSEGGNSLPAGTSIETQATCYAALVKNCLEDFECRQVLLFTSVAREQIVKATKTQLEESYGRFSAGVDVQIIPVGHVNPDENVAQTWKKKCQFVREITRERLHSDEEDIPEEAVRLIALSSLKLDLLRKNHKMTVSLHQEEKDQRCDQKAGSFLQYNCARICSLLKQFDDMVEDGTYPEVPVGGVDASVLTDNQEWELVFKYLCSHPEMLALAYGHPENVSRLVQWLISFSLEFSSYYNRTHILTDPREHLYPKMFARIQLLKSLRNLLSFWLKVFDLPLLTEV